MISVITSVNDEESYERVFMPCINRTQELLRSLNLPELDLVKITGAESIMGAYSLGQEQAIFRLKAYIHQDVDLLDSSWVFKLLRSFAEYPNFALLGLVGTTRLPDRGFWWESGKEFIRGELFSGKEKADWVFSPVSNVTEVESIDGFFMASNSWLHWDKRIPGWHFYDMEISRRVREWCDNDSIKVGVLPHKAWHIGEIRSNEGVQELLDAYHKRWGDT